MQRTTSVLYMIFVSVEIVVNGRRLHLESLIPEASAFDIEGFIKSWKETNKVLIKLWKKLCNEEVKRHILRFINILILCLISEDFLNIGRCYYCTVYKKADKTHSS